MSLARTVALAALLVAVAPAERAAASAWSPERTAAAPISEPVVADTLRYQVRAGQPLLVSLPSRVGGREATYGVEVAPAMSWLVDRSFFWQTLASERGEVAVVFRQTAAAEDVLVLLVEVTP